MAQTYPKGNISSELSDITPANQIKINEIVALFAQLVLNANS